MFSPTPRFAPLPGYASPGPGSVTLPAGYRAAGVHAGIKRSRRDLGILVSDVAVVSAVFFTSNSAAAAPVLVTRDTCDCTALQAVVVNSGIANACTGRQGHVDALRMRALAAAELGLPLEKVAVSSTGVMGDPLPMDIIEKGIHRVAGKLAADGGEHFAAAIRTTDRTEKRVGLTVETSGGEIHIGFASKGAGMVSPNMATTLSFVTTDAAVPAVAWHEMMAHALAESFNRITVDGQESTNDMVLGFANGASGVPLDDDGLERVHEALCAGLLAMALGVVADGEGATKTVRLRVSGAHDSREAERVARAIANSPLVKAAVFGHDANWGRIVQAAGMWLSHDDPRPLACDVAYDDLELVHGGNPLPLDVAATERLERVMTAPELDLQVELRRGSAATLVYFSDLTYDYVRLNAGRRT